MSEVVGAVPVKRAFIDIDDGQLHLRKAGEPKAGQTPLFIFHQSPNSSRVFEQVLGHLGRTRFAVALDTPGFGESFRPASQPTIADYARWLSQAPAAFGFDRFDVMGLFTGAGIASEMAANYPDLVRRVVLAGPPMFTEAQQKGFVYHAWPMRPREDGGNLMFEWGRVISRSLPDQPIGPKLDAFIDLYRGGANAIWGEQSIAEYPLKDVLPRVQQKTLVIRPQGIHGNSGAAAALLAHGRLVDVDFNGYSMMSARAAEVARLVDEFLNEPGDD